jgi:predicted nucleic acid-binding protein
LITILRIDLKSALRKRKSVKRTSQLIPRPQSELVDLLALPGRPLMLMLDTNVYINRAAGRVAPHVRDAIDNALLFHCSVALAELAVGVANAVPTRPGWSDMCDHYAELFANIPTSRLLKPDEHVWIAAGVDAGTLARTQGFPSHQRKECLNDALIFLTAAKAGVPVLTANRVDFDLIQQIAPEGQFIHC